MAGDFFCAWRRAARRAGSSASQWAGKTRDAGLGPFPVVSLAKARELAEDCRRLLAASKDPVEERRAARQAARNKTATGLTFGEYAEEFITAHEAAWRNDKHCAQWRATLKKYVDPVMRDLSVDAIGTEDVLTVLRPIWTGKPETASRVRGRIEAILDAAKAQGLRAGENPARWRGHLNHLLPAKTKVRRVRHHAALPYADVPSFMAELREETSISARALEFLILTASRTGETLGARFDEIDFAARMWTIPAERMKAARDHRVPLVPRAVDIVKEMAAVRQNEFVFPGMKPGRSLSQTALLMLLRRLGYGYVVTSHGMRSSFRDWAAEKTTYPREVAEMALAHAVPDAVEAAYRRGDLFAKRRALMQAWAAHCARACVNTEVVASAESAGLVR